MRRVGPCASRLAVFASVLLVVLASEAQAVILCDAPDDHLTAGRAEFQGVGYLSTCGGTTGVLVSPMHVLTARHAVDDIAGATFALPDAGGMRHFTIAAKHEHPDADVDLVILELTECADFGGYGLYTGRDEVGQSGIVVGFGVSGVGRPQPDEYPGGAGRFGYNMIEASSAAYLKMRFDCLPEEQEAVIGRGDSGGPTFLSVDGELLVAGIHKAVSDFNADGIAPEYGDVAFDVRVSDYADWIYQTVPEPGSVVLVALGGLAVLLRRYAPRR